MCLPRDPSWYLPYLRDIVLGIRPQAPKSEGPFELCMILTHFRWQKLVALGVYYKI